MNLTEVKLLQKIKQLELCFDTGERFNLPCWYLRAGSPSAQNRTNPETIDRDVNIVSIQPVGNYALKLVFDDGHDTGLYSWETLYQLALAYKD
jgi:DUF971 family protein